MGNYESNKFGRTIEVDPEQDLGTTDLSAANIKLSTMIDEMLEKELREAADLTDVRNSYILTVIRDKYGDTEN